MNTYKARFSSYCNKCLNWAWIAQTVYFTLLFHGKSRKGEKLEKRFGDSIERMTAVTDRHSAYFTLHFLNHQVCLAHLLRECQYLNELDKNQQWSKSVIRKLKIKLKNSGCFRSDLGADAFMDLHSIVETTKKKTATLPIMLYSPYSKGERLIMCAEISISYKKKNAV